MNFDIDFTVPLRHRVRFTTDLAGRDFEVLTELIVANDDIAPPTKVLLIVDHGVAKSVATSQLVSRLGDSKQIMVMDCSSVTVRKSTVNESADNTDECSTTAAKKSPAYIMMGGEICKNDTDDCLLYTSPSPRDRG